MKQYEKMMPDENLSWCKPMVSKDGRVTIAVNEGAVVGLMLDGKDLQPSNWSDTHILLDGDFVEIGCGACPWRDICDAMDEK